jgi:hypothetical protein
VQDGAAACRPPHNGDIAFDAVFEVDIDGFLKSPEAYSCSLPCVKAQYGRGITHSDRNAKGLIEGHIENRLAGSRINEPP